ncbi:diheme cytochrome C [Leptolyngbya sp. Cla-17]|uniref:diheme cytochrome C n=1 Tax=Leptolyngbya sp. Cla-17 TaxID=2803751 RepID=UPI001490FF34|nr:diheme cytochrome C [Leptolyngbya sp. Cla-17]
MTSPKRNFQLNRDRTRRTSRQFQPTRQRSIWVLLVLLLLWSLCLGIGLAQAIEPKSAVIPLQERDSTAQLAAPSDSKKPDSTKLDSAKPGAITAAIGTVDVISERYKLGQQLYLENCATCHIALPPAVMPSQTWRSLLQDAEHYGATIKPLGNPEVQIVWQYLRDFSRSLTAEEQVPYRIYQSSYFKLLHPRVKFPERASLITCISCHPGAGTYDFRSLSAEWQNAP